MLASVSSFSLWAASIFLFTASWYDIWSYRNCFYDRLLLASLFTDSFSDGIPSDLKLCLDLATSGLNFSSCVDLESWTCFSAAISFFFFIS
jgi:hypothetical protein